MNSSKQSARENRIARDTEREQVRSALRFGASYGYYVFDELVTEDAGTLDYLAVGALGMCAIIIREGEGVLVQDPYSHEWYWNGYPFEDDPRQQETEMTDDLKSRLRGAQTHTKKIPVESIICVSGGEIHSNGSDNSYSGITDLMTLPLVVFGQGEDRLTPEDIDALASEVERVYRRPPFVRPDEPDGGSTI